MNGADSLAENETATEQLLQRFAASILSVSTPSGEYDRILVTRRSVLQNVCANEPTQAADLLDQSQALAEQSGAALVVLLNDQGAALFLPGKTPIRVMPLAQTGLARSELNAHIHLPAFARRLEDGLLAGKSLPEAIRFAFLADEPLIP